MAQQQFGRYQILEILGKGGMATVYRAYDPRFKREVALKVLPREFLHDDSFRARFEREAQTVAGLEHSAIVPVYDFGEQAGQPYLVMRLMSGGSLAQRLDEGPINLTNASRIFSRLAAALDFAHRHGVIHRDLKPANILFDSAGDPFLSDFGIVKLLEGSETALTVTGGLVGTPTYMSPEQVRQPRDIDGRSDIYAMGIILFEMLAGKVPFENTTPMAIAMMHVLDPVPDILATNPDLPEGCREIIDRAMAKTPADRFQTAAALAATVNGLAQQATGRPEQLVQEATAAAAIPAKPEQADEASGPRVGAAADVKPQEIEPAAPRATPSRELEATSGEVEETPLSEPPVREEQLAPLLVFPDEKEAPETVYRPVDQTTADLTAAAQEQKPRGLSRMLLGGSALVVLLLFCGLGGLAVIRAARNRNQTPTPEAARPAVVEATRAVTNPTRAATRPEPTAAPGREVVVEPTAGPIIEPQNIVIWHSWSGDQLAVARQLMIEYTAERPELSIQPVFQPDIVQALLETDDGPDLVVMGNNELGRAAQEGRLEPVSPWFSSDELFGLFTPTAASALIWRGDVWGIPLSQEGIAIVFNRALVDESILPADPFDFGGLLAAAEQFRATHPDKYLLCNQGLGISSENAFHAAPIYFGFGPPDEVGFLDEAGNVFVNTPERMAAAEWIAAFRPAAPEETGQDICLNGLLEGTFGAMWTGPWALPALEEAGIEYGIRPFGRTFVGVQSLLMGHGAAVRGHVDIAADIMRYFSQPEIQIRLVRPSRQVPASNAALTLRQLRDTLNIDDYIRALEAGIPIPNAPFVEAQWGPMGAATAAIFRGEPPEQVLADTQAAIENLIAEMR